MPYPPGSHRTELEAALAIKLLSSSHQADVAFLNKIEQVKPTAHIVLSNADHEPQVVIDQHFIIGGSLLRSGEQRPMADLFEVEYKHIKCCHERADPP